MSSPLQTAGRALAAATLLAASAGAFPADLPPLPAAAASAAEPKLPPEPSVQHNVIDDAEVRVDELKVRGQVQSVRVQSKIPGVAPYEIVTGTTGRDPGGEAERQRGAVGHTVWHFLSF